MAKEEWLKQLEEIKKQKFSFTFDGTDFRDLITVEEVKRPLASEVENELVSNRLMTGAMLEGSHRKPLYITVKYNFQNKKLSPLRRVLGQYLVTDELCSLIFSDEPDRYYMAKIDGATDVDESHFYAKGSLTFLVPDGLAHAVNAKDVYIKSASTVVIENNGSDVVYPQIECHFNSESHMLAVSTKGRTFQWGETLELSPLKKVKFTTTEQVDAGFQRRNAKILGDTFENTNGFSTFDAQTITGDWLSAGSFTAGGKKAEPTPTNGKIKIGTWATHWQTGERMAPHVKGGMIFDVVQTKNVRQSHSTKAYLLKKDGWYIGWLLSQDIDNGSNHLATPDGSVSPNYGSGSGWHGPAVSFPMAGEATDWSIDLWHWFHKAQNHQMGAVYVGVWDEQGEIAGCFLSAHRPSIVAEHTFRAGGRGIGGPGSHAGHFVDFYGRTRIIKKGTDLTFDIWNDRTKRGRVFSAHISESLASRVAKKAVVWCGQYGDMAPLQDNRLDSIYATGHNAKVWVDAHSEIKENIMNLPDPKVTVKAGDMLTLNMADNTAYLNGARELTPIAYASRSIAIPPGRHEILISTDGDVAPDVYIRYREVYK